MNPTHREEPEKEKNKEQEKSKTRYKESQINTECTEWNIEREITDAGTNQEKRSV